MSNPTYKIRIIKTGIGDPFLLGEFEFDTNGYSNPADDPVYGLNIKVEFSKDGESFPNYGNVVLDGPPLANWQMNNDAGTNARYFFGLPFDPGPNYTSQQTIWLRLTFTCSNGSIQLGDGSNNHETYMMSYMGTPVDLPTVSVYYYWPTV